MTEWMPGDMHRYGRSATVSSSQTDLSSLSQIPAHPYVSTSPHIHGNNPQHNQKGASPVLNAMANGTTPHFADDRRIHHGNGRSMPTPNRLTQESNDSHSRIGERPRSGNTVTIESECEPDVEWVEQDEQGVYITLVSLPGGARDLKRVRFR